MNCKEITGWLRERDPRSLEGLWLEADRVRRESVGDDVHLRGLVEFSNRCRRSCAYCGLRAPNNALARYRMSETEILDSARRAVSLGYGTVVLQSGEEDDLDPGWMAKLICEIKRETPLAVTLSLGERTESELALWRDAGADRYLLRFETSNRRLYDRIHPGLPGVTSDRFTILRTLKRLGYETGSGVLVGLPGQTYEDLAEDILWFERLDLDMVGLGPYIPHPATPMADGRRFPPAAGDAQVANNEEMACKALALTRLLRPLANIPGTTALATISQRGRETGLERGANVIMPNVTPLKYRRLYEIYPAKACLAEDGDFDSLLKTTITRMGRKVATGRGDSLNMHGGHPSLHNTERQ